MVMCWQNTINQFWFVWNMLADNICNKWWWYMIPFAKEHANAGICWKHWVLTSHHIMSLFCLSGICFQITSQYIGQFVGIEPCHWLFCFKNVSAPCWVVTFTSYHVTFLFVWNMFPDDITIHWAMFWHGTMSLIVCLKNVSAQCLKIFMDLKKMK